MQSCPEVNLQTVLTVNWSLDSRDDQVHYLHNILLKEKIQFKGWVNADTPLVICGDTALSWINCWSWVLITNTWESGHNFQTHHISQRQLFRSACTSRMGRVYVVNMLSICVCCLYWSQENKIADILRSYKILCSKVGSSQTVDAASWYINLTYSENFRGILQSQPSVVPLVSVNSPTHLKYPSVSMVCTVVLALLTISEIRTYFSLQTSSMVFV